MQIWVDYDGERLYLGVVGRRLEPRGTIDLSGWVQARPSPEKAMSDLDLAALLDVHREELDSLSGVVGSGLGAEAVHIFVAPAADAEEVRQKAKRVLSDAPVEVIVMEPPEAYSSS